MTTPAVAPLAPATLAEAFEFRERIKVVLNANPTNHSTLTAFALAEVIVQLAALREQAK